MAKIDQAHRAGVVWSTLAKAASTEHPFVTYADLGRLLGTVPLAVRYALGPIQRYCIAEGLPPLTMLVVSKSTGKQGQGYVGGRTDDALEEVLQYPWKDLENPFSDLRDEEINAIVRELIEEPGAASGRYVLTLSRGNQQRVFRRAVLKAYGHQCCICGITYEEVLEAAHIVPWRVADPGLRLDPRNGLAMCANHHRLFDRGVLSITDKFTILNEDDSDPADFSEGDEEAVLRHHGETIILPKNKALRPDRKLLRERSV